MGKKILILSILKNLRKRLNLILFTAILSIGMVWVLIAYVWTPQYTATSQVLVEEADAAVQTAGRQSTLKMPSLDVTASAIIKSPEVLKRVILELELEKTMVPDLHDRISVLREVDSKVLNITVTSRTKKEAAMIADTVAFIFIEESPALMAGNKMSFISSAAEMASASPFEDNMVFSLGIAGAFGLIVGTLLAFILELLNTVFKTGPRKDKEKKEKLQTVFK